MRWERTPPLRLEQWRCGCHSDEAGLAALMWEQDLETRSLAMSALYMGWIWQTRLTLERAARELCLPRHFNIVVSP